MTVFSSPFRYLRLRNERRTRLIFRDALPIAILTACFSLPFLIFDQVNFSRPSGLVDQMGSLASILAGFYIAALVAVGSFSASIGDLDDEISNGKIFVSPGDETSLTRREYICAIFGFLSFMALLIAVLSSFILIVSGPLELAIDGKAFTVRGNVWNVVNVMRAFGVVAYSATVSTMIITTFYGLYYLTDRIYAKAPKILPKDENVD
jgi:SNF family Na+-dependent transporter